MRETFSHVVAQGPSSSSTLCWTSRAGISTTEWLVYTWAFVVWLDQIVSDLFEVFSFHFSFSACIHGFLISFLICFSSRKFHASFHIR